MIVGVTGCAKFAAMLNTNMTTKKKAILLLFCFTLHISRIEQFHKVSGTIVSAAKGEVKHLRN